MLILSFFATVLTSILWLIFIAFHIGSQLSQTSLGAIGMSDMALILAVVLLPLLVLWSFWGHFFNLRHEAELQKQFKILSTQISQNQEYIDNVARVLLNGFNQQSHSFAMEKIDMYIGEMNEILADLLRRYRLISDEKFHGIWDTVRLGNRWGFAKAFIELHDRVENFDNKLLKAARSQKLLAGGLTEFCARYTRLLCLLKEHDEENILQDIVETGAFGRVFAFFAPMVRDLHEETEQAEEVVQKMAETVVEDETEDEQPEFLFEPQNKEEEIKETDEADPALTSKQEMLPEQKRIYEKYVEDIGLETISEEKEEIKVPEIFTSEEKDFIPTTQENAKNKKPFWIRLLGLHEEEENEKKSPDVLTLALERSFGSASEQQEPQPVVKDKKEEQEENDISEVLEKIEEAAEISPEQKTDSADEVSSVENVLSEEPLDIPSTLLDKPVYEDETAPKTTRKGRFAFANTNKTIKNLQKEWEEMKKNDKASAAYADDNKE